MLFLAAPKIYWALLFFLFLMVVFFPLVTIYLMYRNKTISSMSIPIRKERLPGLVMFTNGFGNKELLKIMVVLSSCGC